MIDDFYDDDDLDAGFNHYYEKSTRSLKKDPSVATHMSKEDDANATNINTNY